MVIGLDHDVKSHDRTRLATQRRPGDQVLNLPWGNGGIEGLQDRLLATKGGNVNQPAKQPGTKDTHFFLDPLL